ncbi:MAG: T9SS type A sorting domain-containing protein [Bacteroidales bacterium]
MKKITFIFYFLSLTSISFSQSIIRSSINCFGNSTINENVLFRQTAGQPSNTALFINAQQLRQGFQQPISFVLHPFTENDITINIYPNPAKKKTELLISGFISDFEIVISLITGKELKRFHTEKSINSIDCSDLADGIYIVSIVKNNKLYASKKLIIIK